MNPQLYIEPEFKTLYFKENPYDYTGIRTTYQHQDTLAFYYVAFKGSDSHIFSVSKNHFNDKLNIIYFNSNIQLAMHTKEILERQLTKANNILTNHNYHKSKST